MNTAGSIVPAGHSSDCMQDGANSNGQIECQSDARTTSIPRGHCRPDSEARVIVQPVRVTCKRGGGQL